MPMSMAGKSPILTLEPPKTGVVIQRMGCICENTLAAQWENCTCLPRPITLSI